LRASSGGFRGSGGVKGGVMMVASEVGIEAEAEAERPQRPWSPCGSSSAGEPGWSARAAAAERDRIVSAMLQRNAELAQRL